LCARRRAAAVVAVAACVVVARNGCVQVMSAEEAAEELKKLAVSPPETQPGGYPAADAAKKKKKKKKKKAGAEDDAEDAEDDAEEEEEVAEKKEEKKEEEAEKKDMKDLVSFMRPRRICEDSRKNAAEIDHKFWGKQPVPSLKDPAPEDAEDGEIDEPKTVDDVKKEPSKLPGSFEWCSVDVSDAKEIDEVYELLNGHYVEDDDCMFRFDYSRDFIRWALMPPGYKQHWHVGVRAKQSGKLVAFITGIPAMMNVRKTRREMAEINFLCVHKKLRQHRLAPVLITEITRRVNLENIWQAVYTAGVVLPKPVSECRYYHRSLNPKKLIDVGFSHLGPRMTMARAARIFKVPEQPQIPGLRAMVKADVPQVHQILNKYLSQFDLHPSFSEDEVEHWLLPRKGVIYSFVAETKGKVTDLCSFYSLPSSILNNEKYSHLWAAYAYWHVPNTVSIETLMYDSLIMAKQENFDVFNALNVMENAKALENLKFGIGDGFLQYYLYNWRTKMIKPEQIGLVLL